LHHPAPAFSEKTDAKAGGAGFIPAFSCLQIGYVCKYPRQMADMASDTSQPSQAWRRKKGIAAAMPFLLWSG
jgi:hypothetical protein